MDGNYLRTHSSSSRSFFRRLSYFSSNISTRCEISRQKGGYLTANTLTCRRSQNFIQGRFIGHQRFQKIVCTLVVANLTYLEHDRYEMLA